MACVTVQTRPNRPIARYRALKRAIGRYPTTSCPIVELSGARAQDSSANGRYVARYGYNRG